MAARTAATRARYARLGLSAKKHLDPSTQAMLLRQLYLSHFEMRRFREALAVAEQATELRVLIDVLHQDAARAALALGDLPHALVHLKNAVKRGPESRRPFHLWTLGGALFLAARYPEAIAALEKAATTDTVERPLYKAHLALARIAGGYSVTSLQKTIDLLAASPSGQGYGRFVLGHLAYAAGEWVAAKRYLEAFLKRNTGARSALEIALEGEIKMTRATLRKISSN